MRAAIPVFLTAFSRTDDSLAERIFELWTALREGQVVHFQVAKHLQSIVGVGGMCSYSTLAFIGWMAVNPSFRRRGIGNGIFKNLLAYVKEAGIPSLALFATEIGEKLYRNWRFEGQYYVSAYEIPECKEKLKQEGQQEISEILPRWLLEMDKAAFGGDRSGLLRVLLERGKLITSGRDGYGFVVNNQLGPLIANDVEIAMGIVRYAHEKYGARRLSILHHKQLSKQFILKLQLRSLRAPKCLRMILGEEVNEDLCIQYSPFSYATG